ncbi:MAG: hypothetical protein Q7R58_01615 [bacterium]|nr:hypothetical protein [bacterium]
MKKIIPREIVLIALIFALILPTSSSAKASYSLQTQIKTLISQPTKPAKLAQPAQPTKSIKPAQPVSANTLPPNRVSVPSPTTEQLNPIGYDEQNRTRNAADELAQRKTLLSEAVGYGKDATGGANGKIYHVTTLANSGPGSLRDAVQNTDPLWIVFDVSGTIDLNRKSLRIKSNKTIDGRNAHVTLSNAPIQIFDARNIIIENIKIDRNDQMIGMRLLRSNAVWIDHVSFLGGITGSGDPLYANLLAIMDGSSNVTVSWSRFVNQDKGVEIGHSNTKEYSDDESMYVTLHHNYMSANRRNPRINRAHVHAFNNVVSQWACDGYGMVAANNGKLFAEGNVLTAKTGCKNVCKANVSAIRSGDITSKKSCTVDKAGVVLSQNNLFQSGAQLIGQTVSPRQIFNPQNRYNYAVETASAVMEQKVASTAGATR